MAETVPALQTSINLPQIIAVALVGFFAIRWYLNKPAGGGTGGGPPGGQDRSRRGGQAVDLTKVEQVAAMFPQLDRRTIAWDLQSNGGNVSATTERVLGGRGLDNPPPSFQPSLPAPGTQAPAVGVSGGAGSKAGGGASAQQDLIARYGLQARIGGKGKEAVPSEEQLRRQAWSSDKAARAEGLRKRREEMVLEARRRMQERDAGA
ncbi:hypothetical protein LTR36_004543 [Oleoguttula mirabilis]|uniref:Coupling of ubiquitin conjugation to ER degradation protein 1 n=1 Tax=Oleoguttula mirabilis TaxID=1507867 RepID=A0AAV9JFG3_9PEZI|nr:hypothetical protein LTR36_004543 [Oleoguttula mirabilis]